MIKKLFDSADWYLEESDWKDIAVIKFCLCSLGIMIGAAIPENGKKKAAAGAAAVFTATYIPLMGKYFRVLMNRNRADA